MLDALFILGNVIVAPGWLAMLVAPNWGGTVWLARTLALPVLVAALYVMMVVASFGATEGHFFSLNGVELLFQDRRVLLVGWLHYLAFDLFVGSWMFLDARRREIGHLWLVPCLILTLLFGPAGLLLYSVVLRVKGARPGAA